jgi:hypothetical protein
VAAAESMDASCRLGLGGRDRRHRDCCSIHLSFDSHILSGILIELALVALQRVYLAAADNGKIGPLFDAFAGTFCRGFPLHHVMSATHDIGHGAGYGLVRLGERCSDREQERSTVEIRRRIRVFLELLVGRVEFDR